MRSYFIYRLTSPSGHVYIGITQNILRRFKAYKYGQCKNQVIIFNSIVKYGWDAHKKEILESNIPSIEEASKLEKEWIVFERSRGFCSNILDGGLGYNRKQNRKTKPIRQYSSDGHFIQEWPSITRAGLEIGGSDNAATLIGAAAFGRYRLAYGYAWRYVGDKRPIIPSNANPGKSIGKYDANGVLVDTFVSIASAARSVNSGGSCIYECMRNNGGGYAYGFMWKYVNLTDEIAKRTISLID